VVVAADFFWLELLLEDELILNEKAYAEWASAAIQLASTQMLQILENFRLRNLLSLKILLLCDYGMNCKQRDWLSVNITRAVFPSTGVGYAAFPVAPPA
jgi:hypothetical protein